MENTQGLRKSTVGQFIRTRREAVGLSQKTLGGMMEPAVSTQFISNIERGITSLPTHHINKMAAALKIKPQELLVALEVDYSSKISHEVAPNSNPNWYKNWAEFFGKLNSDELSFFNHMLMNYPTSGQETREKFMLLAQQIFPSSALLETSGPVMDLTKDSPRLAS